MFPKTCGRGREGGRKRGGGGGNQTLPTTTNSQLVFRHNPTRKWSDYTNND